jgi:hypothetical protein
VRWPWGRRPVDGGEKALQRAKELQRQTEDRQREIEVLTDRLARRRERNDFGGAIDAIFRSRS